MNDCQLLNIIICSTGFGDDMVKTLVDHFESHLDNTDDVRAEWPLLRTAVFDV